MKKLQNFIYSSVALKYLKANAAAAPARSCPTKNAAILPVEVIPAAINPTITAGLNAPPEMPPSA